MSESYDDSYNEQLSGTDSPNNTYFIPSEASASNRQKFDRLWYYNENLRYDRKNFNGDEVWRRDRLATFDAIASTVGLTQYQRDQARSIVEATNISEESGGPATSIESFCFAACIYSFNNDDAVDTLYLPGREQSRNPTHFVEAKDRLGISDASIRKSLQELRDSII